MSKTKAKGTMMVDVKLRKAQKRIEELTEQASQASMSVLNLRQMYEGAIQEKTVLTARLNNLSSMLTAVVSQGRGKFVRIKEKTLEDVSKYAGIDTKADDGDLILTVLTVEQVEEMQDEIDEELEAV